MAVPLVILSLVAVLAILFYASYDISSGVYLRTFCKKNTTEKVVALTFDDGPEPVNTEKVLDVLKKHDVEAAFFCIGKKIKTNTQIAERIAREGHLLGNHSYSHANGFPLYSKNKMVEEIKATDALINEITDHDVLYFRPPFGVTNPLLKNALAMTRHYVIGWSLRSMDTIAKDEDTVVKKICKKVSPGDVILMHDRLPFTADALDKVIEHLKKEGYTIKRVDKLFNLI